MWDHGSKRWDQTSDGWDHSLEITGHKPWDRDQQFFFRDQGSSCTIFVGSGTKTCHADGIKDPQFGYRNGISGETEISALNT